MSGLTNYEKQEIIRYKKFGIYYTGEHAKKKEPVGSNVKGFTNKKGFYKIIPNDHIRYRYQICKKLGKGSFGTVVQAYDHRKAMDVAIKILRIGKFNAMFEDEAKILKHVNKHMRSGDNIVELLASFRFRSHTCLVMECLDQNLKANLRENGRRPMLMIRDIGHDILKALKFLHRFRIIHGDIKPGNIVFQNSFNNRVKLVDFGCSVFEKNQSAFYMGTRKYRAPEVLLRLPFSRAIDLWGLAVTLYELYKGQPLFDAVNEEDMIVQMVEVFGNPPKDLVGAWRNLSSVASKYFVAKGRLRFLPSRNACNSDLGLYAGKPLSRSLNLMISEKKQPHFLDFLQQCLLWDPNVRISANEGLRHPWLDGPHSF